MVNIHFTYAKLKSNYAMELIINKKLIDSQFAQLCDFYRCIFIAWVLVFREEFQSREIIGKDVIIT